jgi:hypothetical protein
MAKSPNSATSKPEMNQLQDKQHGCLLGLAIGDALGAAVEFKPPGTFEPVASYRAGGPHGLEPGEWTDDTSMALALANSIAAAGWDINDQARRYVAWWTQGEYSVNGRCFDIGITTSSALSRFQETGDGNTSGDTSERASGNGSIMRLAPVPIRFAGYFPDQIEQLAQRAIASTRRRLRHGVMRYSKRLRGPRRCGMWSTSILMLRLSESGPTCPAASAQPCRKTDATLHAVGEDRQARKTRPKEL